MRTRTNPRRPFAGILIFGLAAGLLAIAVPACTELAGPRKLPTLTGLLQPAPDPENAEAEEYRQRFQAEGDPEALRWLLGHRLRQGMTVAEVNRVLGQQGRRVYNDLKFKTDGSPYRATDVAYRWGPDSEGNAVFLFFRDGKLTNYRPEDYR